MNAGEFGRVLNFATQFDMSAATSLSIVFTKPNGTTISPTAVIGIASLQAPTSTFLPYQYVSYTFANGDLDQSGTYTARVSYTDASKHLLSPLVRFNVQP